MEYVIGIDGGGTKTACVLVDCAGTSLDILYAGCSNHQICGIGQATAVIDGLIHNILAKNSILKSDVAFVYMGLAGADSQRDIDMLSACFSESLNGVRFEIANDIWIALASEIDGDWGAITICGTGHNCAVLKPDGEKLGIRALRYALGNYGGGRHITDKAMHYAFRCEEHTGAYTPLAERLPAVCGVKDLNELAAAVYKSGYTFQYDFEIPKLVFELAANGDKVSRHIIRSMGKEMAEMLSGLIAEAGLQDRTVNIVLGGSLFNNPSSGFLINCYKTRLKKTVPSFCIRIATNPPVLGAVLMALKSIHIESGKSLRDKLSDLLKTKQEGAIL